MLSVGYFRCARLLLNQTDDFLMANREDHLLIEAIRNGDDSKYISLMYHRFFQKAKNIVYKGGGNLDDAKDLLHDTLLSFFKHVKDNKYKPETDVEAFLFVSAKNKWINKAVKDKRIDYKETLSEGKLTEVSFIQQLYSKEKAVAIKDILEKLGERCKELLQLVYYEEKSMKEICEIMGYQTADTAKTKHYKCKQRMEAMINENGHYKSLLAK